MLASLCQFDVIKWQKLSMNIKRWELPQMTHSIPASIANELREDSLGGAGTSVSRANDEAGVGFERVATNQVTRGHDRHLKQIVEAWNRVTRDREDANAPEVRQAED
ncbi:hypothetical protein RJT34_11797 [Clitoria ternatea]|uniref:Uncharacterized protein n=1 Tax=Clitoria ternatea TaxID=43366 RepID=A0AAN9JMK9_CLITE